MEEAGLFELLGAALWSDDDGVESGSGGKVGDGLGCGFVVAGDQDVQDLSFYCPFSQRGGEGGCDY
ncbi:hypothetical protein [Pseudarthrobacter sp. MDT1-22]